MLAETMTSEAPASLAEAKAFLRIETAADDALVAGLIRTATALCEAFTGQALLDRETSETVGDASGWRRLGLSPVRAITGVARIGTDGVAGPIAPGDTETDIDARGDGWVRARDGGRLRVTYRAGIATDWNGVPEPLRQGLLRLVAHLYAHRDAPDDAGPPAAVAALWRPWRRMRLG